MAEGLPSYLDLVRFYEAALARYGPETPRGVGWFRDDADTRYRAMLGVVRPHTETVTLLDFGCGLSHLYDYMLRNGVTSVRYAGLDVSPRFIALAREKHPGVTYYLADVLDEGADHLPSFDYVVLNGLFTYKGGLTYAEMVEFLEALIPKVFELASIGIAFNVTTAQVEWTRDDLFHLPVDALLDFLSRHVSRHVVIRHDYGLFEYTAYVYKDPSDPERADVKRVLTSGPRS